MASTYSSNLRFELIGSGEQAGTWGTTTNTNLGTLIEGAIAGASSVSVTSTNQALTYANGAADQSRVAILRLTTTTGANFTVFAPPVSKLYVISNESAYQAQINNSDVLGSTTPPVGGASVTIPAGKVVAVWSNGTSFFQQTTHIEGLSLSGTPTAPTAAAGTNTTQIATTAHVFAERTNTATLTNKTLTSPTINTPTISTPTVTGGNLTGSTLASPLLADPVTNAMNGGQLAGMRNKIINGKMEIAQRGTSFAAIVSGTYSLDRWRFSSNTTSAVITVSRQADVPSSNEFQNSLRLAITTADTSIAASDQVNIQQRIEGYNVRDLIGRTFTLSFWVRSSKTGTHCVYFQNNGQDRSYVATYTIITANTWEYKSVTVTNGLITAGTWDWTTQVGLLVGWTLAAGSNVQTTAGSWQTGNFIATSAQVNCLDSNTNIFALTGAQLEVGTLPTPFEHRPFGTEVALCQRYYEEIDMASAFAVATLQATSTSAARGGFTTFKATKRVAPAISQTGTLVPTLPLGSSAGGTVAPFNITDYGFNWDVSGAAGLTAGNATLLVSVGAVTINISAEL